MHTSPVSVTNQTYNRSTSLLAAVLALISLMIGGCTMTETQERTGTGAAIGALGGAILGTSRESAAIGAVVGAAGGYLYDQYHKREDADAENERLRQENERLKEEVNR